jgi:hypothetical protein
MKFMLFVQSTRGAATFVAKYNSSFPVILKAQPIRDSHSVHDCSGAPELIVYNFKLYFINSMNITFENIKRYTACHLKSHIFISHLAFHL